MYSAAIERKNPSCFLFVLDQSASMADSFGGDATKAKSQGVSDAINRLLQNLVIRCTREEGVRHYYDIGVMGYGGPTEGSILGGALQGRDLVPIAEIADNPIRVESRKKDDGAGGLADFLLPIWFDPVAHGNTPMREGMEHAHSVLQQWIAAHSDSYPPTVIHITDGEWTGPDPTSAAESISKLATSDGNVLLFNIHISSRGSTPIEFPETDEVCPDDFGRVLFQWSDVLPTGLFEAAKGMGFDVTPRSRGFAFNANLVSLVQFLDIGTRQTTEMR